MKSGIRVLIEELQHIFAAHEVQLAGLHGLDRQLVRTAGNYGVQAQNFTGFGDAHNQSFAVARGRAKLGAPLAENKNSAGTLSLDQNHGVLGKNSGMFNYVEGLERFLREVAEKIAGTQTAFKTAFNALQTGYAHRRSFISPQKHGRVGWATMERSRTESRGQARPPFAEGDREVSARRLPFHFGSGTQCLQQSHAGGGQGSPEGWQLCRQLGTLDGAAQALVSLRKNSDSRRFLGRARV